MSLPVGIFQFISDLLPVIVKLFNKHEGNARAARRDMESLVDQIAADRAAVDAELKRQREEEG